MKKFSNKVLSSLVTLIFLFVSAIFIPIAVSTGFYYFLIVPLILFGYTVYFIATE